MPINPEVAAELDLVRQHLDQIVIAQQAVADAQVAINVARDGVMTSLGRLSILLEGVENVYPVPASVNLTPGVEELEVDISHPVGIPAEYDYMVIAWGGAQGFIDAQTYARPFPDNETISGLPAELINVDVGYGIGVTAVPADKLVRAAATPLEPDEPEGAWPAAGTWDQKKAWIDAGAGTKTTLKRVGTDGTPQGCTWLPTASPPRLDVQSGTLLDGWEIPGRIYVRSTSGNPSVTLRNVKAWDVFSSESGANRVILVEDCDFDMPASQVINSNWGQGNLNAMRPGFTVRRTRLRHAADNMQCTGPGTVEDTVFADMTIDPEFTHNDFIQNYDGNVNVRRCWFRQTLTNAAVEGGHVNGIFADSSTLDIEDSAIEVFAPAGTNAWAIHAAKQPATIRVRRCRVRGKVVGDVRFESEVDHVNGY